MGRQIRKALKVQLVVTLLIALSVGVAGGVHWGISAFFGGLISVLGGLTYGMMLSRANRGSAENALLAMMRAEAAKLLVIVLLLWLVFAEYEKVFGAGFIGTFIITTLIFSLAVFIRDK